MSTLAMPSGDAPTVAGPVDAPRTAAAPARAIEGPRTLSDAFALYLRAGSVKIMAAALALALAARFYFGGFTLWDAAVVAAFVAYQPFQEWLIHVFILHFRPRKVFGITIDPYVSRKHRRHHENPTDLVNLFIPHQAIWASLVFHPLLWWAVMPTPGLAATAVASIVSLGLVYEWMHFLIHTPYAPKSRLYREIWRLHRLHHFKNEGYWYGVTNHLGDRVLGTNPDPKSVPVSPTARTLGVSATAAAPTEA